MGSANKPDGLSTFRDSQNAILRSQRADGIKRSQNVFGFACFRGIEDEKPFSG